MRGELYLENQICSSLVFQSGMWGSADGQMKDRWEELFGKLVEFFDANEDLDTSGSLFKGVLSDISQTEMFLRSSSWCRMLWLK